tara:strand:+ start:371 stop:1726 length:1356 start_codon:yes stop_codon:yes gene_type:complete
MKKIAVISLISLFLILFVSFWQIVSKGYDRQNKIILTIKKIIPSHLVSKIKNTVFFIPNLKEKNRVLSLQVKKYEQDLEGQLFINKKVESTNGNNFNLREFFLPFPRLDLRLGWAATENSKRAHYLEIIDDKVLVISGLGQTIYFEKNNINKDKLEQTEIPNNISSYLKSNDYQMIGIRDLFYDEGNIYISILHRDNKGITINVLKAKYNFEKLIFETFFKTNEYWEKYNVFSGGRLEKFEDNKILFSVGYASNYEAAQKKESFLGKIISLEKNTKKAELVSYGHRNPQGLFFSKENNLIINTEHGPFGGDEINFNFLNNTSIEKNFGWPISSTGKPYPGEIELFKKKNWLTKTHEQNNFIGPVKSFSPAIGISEIHFDNKKDLKTLFVSSLRAGSIYILNFDNKLKKILGEDRLFFKEQRIRDLEYDSELDVFFVLFEYTPSVGILKKIN